MLAKGANSLGGKFFPFRIQPLKEKEAIFFFFFFFFDRVASPESLSFTHQPHLCYHTKCLYNQNHITLTMLCADPADDKFMIFFLFFPENRI